MVQILFIHKVSKTMAFRNPLKILVVGTAGKENQQSLIESIKQSDSSAQVMTAIDAGFAVETLRDNEHDFDAVYITFKDINSLLAVEAFVNVANESKRKKNGVLVFADASDLSITESTRDQQKRALGIKHHCYARQAIGDAANHQLVIKECRARQQMREELMPLADAVKRSLNSAARQLEEEINKMASSSCYRWAPNDRGAFVTLADLLRTAASTFSLTMSNEDFEKFNANCSELTEKARVNGIDHQNSKQGGFTLVLGLLAALVLFGAAAALAIAAHPVVLAIAAVVAVCAVIAIVVAAVAGYSCLLESDAIIKSKNASLIIENKFAKDASGSFLFKPKREANVRISSEGVETRLSTNSV